MASRIILLLVWAMFYFIYYFIIIPTDAICDFYQWVNSLNWNYWREIG